MGTDIGRLERPPGIRLRAGVVVTRWGLGNSLLCIIWARVDVIVSGMKFLQVPRRQY